MEVTPGPMDRRMVELGIELGRYLSRWAQDEAPDVRVGALVLACLEETQKWLGADKAEFVRSLYSMPDVTNKRRMITAHLAAALSHTRERAETNARFESLVEHAGLQW